MSQSCQIQMLRFRCLCAMPILWAVAVVIVVVAFMLRERLVHVLAHIIQYLKCFVWYWLCICKLWKLCMWMCVMTFEWTWKGIGWLQLMKQTFITPRICRCTKGFYQMHTKQSLETFWIRCFRIYVDSVNLLHYSECHCLLHLSFSLSLCVCWCATIKSTV